MKSIQFCICVSGFTQTRGYYHGILHLREALIKEGHGCNPNRRVWYVPWTTDWKALANDIRLTATVCKRVPRVLVTGYSYGGWGAIQLCRELERMAIKVPSLILCDPVRRPTWLPRPLPALSSMLGRQWALPLRVPANVGRVDSFYQTSNRPQGHRIKCDKLDSYQPPVHVNHLTHDKMDDYCLYHDQVLSEARILNMKYGDHATT